MKAMRRRPNRSDGSQALHCEIMTETLDGRPRLGEISESEVSQYRALSGMAVAGFGFGLLSPLAFIGPVLYVFPIVGVALSVVALARISKNLPAFTGRRIALAGLVVSTLCISIAPSQLSMSRYLLRREARQYASFWFRCLAQDEPHKAHQLSREPRYRAALDDQLWDLYANNPRLIEELDKFLSKHAVRTLLALGEGAQVRFYETQDQYRRWNEERVYLIYAVTYQEESRKKTFFVGIKVALVSAGDDAQASWFVEDIIEHAQPEEIPI